MINHLDDHTVVALSATMKITSEVCASFEESFGNELSNQSKMELNLFCLFYCWLFLQERNIIKNIPENAMAFVVLGYDRVNSFYK